MLRGTSGLPQHDLTEGIFPRRHPVWQQPMADAIKTENEPIAAAKSRTMQTFRMPRELIAFLKAEANRGRQDLTAHVVRWLEGTRSYFGLPRAATALLDADRESLGMTRYDYLLHVLFQRSLQLREKGVGFDAPHESR
jgi:hypothetical protein